ncbi:hypothetical protein HanXRQr2_Chr16g0755571 [Helianthus annuus]|uniref:Uncharacterized protein n=1 Tax=Helianthus annuus TaxID=4232 RepID=A0A9K3GZ92_HELAN|nr:hypothetical protein HanXRQr2_Chr16g0755571 [Helianthus annuus]KAJ0821768.1 hypothetical protein HanPSC8_Chr16g0724101 [Helianthus annuus]
MVDSGYSRSTPFLQWVPREYSGLSLLTVLVNATGYLKAATVNSVHNLRPVITEGTWELAV